ncbi:MAG: preprotein translocase subunit YajC [Planctomycetota bacterium]
MRHRDVLTAARWMPVALAALIIALAPAAALAQNGENGETDDDGAGHTPLSTEDDEGGTGGKDAKPSDGDGDGGGETADDGKEGEDGPPPPLGCGQLGGGGMMPFIIILGGFLLLYFWMGRSRRKQEAKRREMLANLKKGDKVTSIGGICGTVVEVREDEVVVKVDENTRMRMARWAVRGVGEEAKTERPEQQNK